MRFAQSKGNAMPGTALGTQRFKVLLFAFEQPQALTSAINEFLEK